MGANELSQGGHDQHGQDTCTIDTGTHLALERMRPVPDPCQKHCETTVIHGRSHFIQVQADPDRPRG